MTSIYLFSRHIVVPFAAAIALAVLLSIILPWSEADIILAPILCALALTWGGIRFYEESRDAWK